MNVPIKKNNCLSAIGGKFELPEIARKIICFTSNGHMYVSKGSELSEWSLACQEFLRRSNKEFRVISKNSNDIKERYSRDNSREISYVNNKYNTSLRQIEVIKLIREAVASRASDIHLIINESRTIVRFRIDGTLVTINELSMDDGHNICSTIYQTMCDVAEPVFNPHRSQDARLDLTSITGLNLYGGRIATRPTDSGLLMVIRLLYNRLDSTDMTLLGLGYLPEQIDYIRTMTDSRFGINILSGPTGSGKSTTLEVILKNLIKTTRNSSHVLTIEDPPEYHIDGAVQTPIICDKDEDLSISREWARAISNAMRLDPDILMCGEIRDAASAVATFRAAMTGHIVWTTLHANDALAILTRLEDIGISKNLMLDSNLLTGLVNQVLVRKLCEGCKVRYIDGASLIDEKVRERIEKFCDINKVFLKGPGCNICSEKGVKGRTVIAECINPNNDLFKAYQGGGKYEAYNYWINEMNGISKFKALLIKIDQGIIDPRDGEMDLGYLRAN